MTDSRNPPANVARQLRKEAFFGCVKCGFPFVTYHHIVPWEEEHHFRPADMVAVCPNCHIQFHRMTKERQRRYKRNPYNKNQNNLWARMQFAIPCNAFALGESLIRGCPTIAAIDEHPLLAWSIIDGSVALDATLFSREESLMLQIRENQIWINPSAAWDFNFKFNHIMLRSAPRNLLWELDLRRDPAKFFCKTYFNGCEINIGKSGIRAKGPRYKESSIAGFEIANAETAIQFDTGRKFPRSPNVAFMFPLGGESLT